jgi:hypothetical protein
MSDESTTFDNPLAMGQGMREETELYEFNAGGERLGVLGCAVGAPFAIAPEAGIEHITRRLTAEH